MALMARIVGIPSRVAVGFLPGTRNGGVWTVTARDSHAWPELYFSGYGWVRYEPTPSAVTGSAPSWTLPQAQNAGATQTDLPNIPQPTVRPSSGTNPQDPTDATHAHNATAKQTFNWGRFVGLTGGGLLLLALLSSPAAIRIIRRRSRLGGGGAGSADGDPGDRIEAGWAEVRDTIRDLRRSWPAGSPRSIAAAVGRFTNAPTRDALQRLSVLVERERYARAFTDAGSATEAISLVRQIRHGLAADRSWRSRVATTVLPRSVFRRRP
jgi:transglutaminase-like putative cysteine protease